MILLKSVRDEHHWDVGTEFAVESVGDGVLRPLKAVAHTRLDDVSGCLRVTGPARTVEEMDAAIITEIGRRRARAVTPYIPVVPP